MRILLLSIFLWACSTSNEPEKQAFESHVECRKELECRLSGECQTGANDVANCAQSHCSGSFADINCITTHCVESLTACYFRGKVGNAQCAATWQCFGDCKDDADCLNQCIEAMSLTAQPLFLSVELCTDSYVFRQCTAPTEECDQQAAQACGESLALCIDNHELEPTVEIVTVCSQTRSPKTCERNHLRILAACPSADAQLWLNHIDCLAQRAAAESCDIPKLSPVCDEITAFNLQVQG